jgi:diguanylate cyclase (GGDEF)-like protein
MTIKRRNGVGSRQLQEVVERFRRGQIRLIRALEEEELISSKEAKNLVNALDKAVSQKRSSDLLGAAQNVSSKLLRIVRRNRLGEAERVDAELEILYEISRTIQSTLDRQELLGRILNLVNQLVPYENATLFLRSPKTGRLVPGATRGRHVDLICGVEFEHGSGFSAWVAKQKRIVILPELHRGRRADDLEVGSFACVPLLVQGELIGVLNLSHPKPQTFQEEQKRTLSLIASQIAAVIQRLLMFEEMAKLAITDELTGLFNRRYFLRRLDEEVERARRYEQPFSVLFVDVDHFKALNDSLGHGVGDKVLVELAQCLKRWARGSDIVARYGGDEFVVLLPMTDPEKASRVGERIREQVSTHPFPRRKRVTVSVGIAGYPESGSEAHPILMEADRALYRAKGEGRNRVVVATRKLTEAVA